MEANPNEICEYLAYHVSRDYALIKLLNVTYKESTNELTSVFLFDDQISKKVGSLKNRLEQEYKSAVALDVKYIFEYQKSYIDETMLALKMQKLLRSEFSVLTLDLVDDDIQVKRTNDGFSINLFLPLHTAEFVKSAKSYNKFIADLHEHYFCTFSFYINNKEGMDDDSDALAKLEQYMQNETPNKTEVKQDKVRKVREVEYLLGRPVKERPIKIEFLKVNSEEQIIAGTINFLKKRAYTKKGKEGAADEEKPYWTFVLDDGGGRAQCVFFPTTNTVSKFEKLVDGTTVCVIGVNEDRNGRVGFRVSGVSFCELL